MLWLIPLFPCPTTSFFKTKSIYAFFHTTSLLFGKVFVVDLSIKLKNMTLLMELVYNEWTSQMTISLLSIPFFIVLYIFRKIFPFNIIWYFLMAILIYASIGYVKKELKEWWNK